MEKEELILVEEALAEKKEELRRLDENLFQELARQKIVQELLEGMGDLSYEPSSSSKESLQNSMSVSNSSIVSYDTEFVEGELQKVKDYSKTIGFEYKVFEKSVVKPKKRRIFREEQQEKEVEDERKSEKKSNLQEKQIFKKTQLLRINTPEIQQLNQEELKREFYDHQKTLLKERKKQQQLEKEMNLKQTWRQESLKQERWQIRQQLLAEEKAKQQVTAKNASMHFAQSNPLPSNIFLYDSLTLSLQRTIKFSSIMRDLSKANRKGKALQQKLRNSSFFR